MGLKTMVQDGWRNLIAGLGGTRDKRAYTEPGIFVRYDDTTLANAYLTDRFSRNVVDFPADDMTREWIEVEHDPEKVIVNKLRDVRAESKFNEALKWARLYGGAFIVLGIMDGKTLDKPLNRDDLVGKTLEWLYVGDRSMVLLGESQIEKDTRSPKYGQIIAYKIRFVHNADTGVYNDQMVDASRVLIFHGDLVPKNGAKLDRETKFWGASVVQSTWTALSDFGGITSAVASQMYELIISIFKFKGLAEKLASGKEADIVNRMEIIGMSKSLINAVLLDETESFERNAASLAGIPEIIDRFMMILSGACRIPVTRLFGRSPAGMNATGESDLTNYYDAIRSSQKNDLGPALQTLVDIIAAIEEVEGEDHMVVFNPLQQPNPTTEATIKKDEAAALKTYADALVSLTDTGIIGADEALEILKARAVDEYSEFIEVLGAPIAQQTSGVATFDPEED